MQLLTEEWVKAWQEKINANVQYRQSARGWEWPIILILEKDPSVGLDEDRAVFLDLYHGDCREARVATREDFSETPFIISGDLNVWKQVLGRRLDPISAIIRGRMKLIKGNMSTLSAYVTAAKYLVESSLELETEYPDGN